MSSGATIAVAKSRAQFLLDNPLFTDPKIDAVAATGPTDANSYAIADWANFVEDTFATLVGRGYDHATRLGVLEAIPGAAVYPTFENAAPRAAAFTAASGTLYTYDATAGTFQIDAPPSPLNGAMFGVKNANAVVTALTFDANGSTGIENANTGAVSASEVFGGAALYALWQFNLNLDRWISV